MEDRPDVAELAKMVIEEYGYTCVLAYSAKEALTLMHGESFDLFFTDLIMPGGMNGVMLGTQLRQSVRNLPRRTETSRAYATVKTQH